MGLSLSEVDDANDNILDPVASSSNGDSLALSTTEPSTPPPFPVFHPRDPSTYPEDPFPKYEPQDDEIDFDQDEEDNFLASAYQLGKFHYRGPGPAPTEWRCDVCEAHLIEYDIRYHCTECGNYDLCESCYKKGERHVHRNGTKYEDYLYLMIRGNWRYSRQAVDSRALGIGKIEQMLFQTYAPRHFIGTRPSPSDRTFYWMTYREAYDTIVLLAQSLIKIATKMGYDENEETVSARPFVGILTGIRVSSCLFWFASHFAGWPYVTIPRIVTLSEKRSICDECSPVGVIVTEKQYLDDVITLFGEEEGEGEENQTAKPVVVLLDEDVDVLLLGREPSENGVTETNDSSSLQILTLTQFMNYERKEEEEEGQGEETDTFEPLKVNPSSPGTLIYTSGTSGRPKGVVFTFETLCLELHYPIFGDCLRLAYAPFAHLTGIHFVYQPFFGGGRVAMLTQSDLTYLFDDCKLLRPTHISAFPRICQFVHDEFNTRCLERPLDEEFEQKVYESMRDVFGDRVMRLDVGSAPCSMKVKRFMRRLCRCPVHDGYGITEVGNITVDHNISEDVEYEIIACPELGYSPDDEPYPRGEIIVKTPLTKQIFYYKNQQAMDKRFDADGFFHTGDIVEVRGTKILVIDRRSNVIKLAQGEFISLESVEATLQFSPLLLQVVVFPNPPKTCFVAIVQSVAMEDDNRPYSAKDVLDEMHAVGRGNELPHWAIPTQCYVTLEDLPLTAVRKKARNRVKERYESELETMFTASLETSSFNLREHILELLGTQDVDLEAEWGSVGGDSMSGVVLVSTLRSLGIRRPFHEIQRMKVGEILDLVGERALIRRENEENKVVVEQRSIVHLPEEIVVIDDEITALKDLVASLRGEMDPELLQSRMGKMPAYPYAIFLTGASGFFGFRILQALLDAFPEDRLGEICCLVRLSSAPRLRELILERISPLNQEKITLVIGDLAKPRFGLDSDQFGDYADDIDLIIHCGAFVNHLLLYDDHYPANVRSVTDLVRLSEGWKPILFISSMSAWSHRDVDGRSIKNETHRHGRGYGASKWAADVLFSECCSDHCVVVRPTLISGSSETGYCNAKDWFCRIVKGMIETNCLPSTITNGSVPFDMISVDLLSDFVADLSVQISSDVADDDSSVVPLFTGEGINTCWENITVNTLLEYAERFCLEENEEIPSKIPFDEWVSEMESSSTALSPFIELLRNTQRIGDETFASCSIGSRLGDFVEAKQTGVDNGSLMMTYDGFVKIAKALKQVVY